MIDMHTHVIPEFDDGSSSALMSLDMLKELKASGFDKVVLTSHFYPHKISLSNYYIKREAALKVLAEAIKNQTELPQLYLGCELYLTPQIFNYSDISGLCINKTKYVMTELPWGKNYSEQMYNDVVRLMNDFSVVPMLAHIERYDFLMDERILQDFIELGCKFQVNITSVAKHEYKKKLLKYLEKGYVSAIGTDSHYAPIKQEEIDKSISLISKKLDSNVLDDITYKSNIILGA